LNRSAVPGSLIFKCGATVIITVGKIIKSHGIRGEVKVYPLTDRIENLCSARRLFIEKDDYGNWHRVLSLRLQNKFVLIMLSGIDDRDTADRFRNALLKIPSKNRKPLEEGVYYVSDLIGMRVRTAAGKDIGIVRDVLQNTAQDLWVVEAEQSEYLIPAVSEYIKRVDVQNREILIDPIEGLLD